MTKNIDSRLAALELKVATYGGEYIIKINNSTVEITKIINPGNIRKTVDEYDSPLEAVRACEDFILRRRLNIIPYCRFDNIIDIYPEVADIFEDIGPIKSLLHPSYGRDGLSVHQFELRHILPYRHVAALVYGDNHNAYAVGEHPDTEQFEALMSLGAVESQIALIGILLLKGGSTCTNQFEIV